MEDTAAERMEEGELWLQPGAPAPHGYWLKRQLWLCFGHRPITKEDDAQENDSRPCRFRTRKWLVVALLLVLALVIMGLLLLWNYQCIMVWHMCYEEDEYPGVPTFGDG